MDDELKVCEVVSLAEGEAFFSCSKPVKYKIILEGLGFEAISCQHHCELFKDEVLRIGIPVDKLKFVEL